MAWLQTLRTAIRWRSCENQRGRSFFSFFFLWALTSEIPVTSAFRSPVTPVLLLRCWCDSSSSAGAPVLLSCHDRGLRNVWFNMLVPIGWPRGDSKNGEKLEYGVRAAHFLRAGRRNEAAEDGRRSAADYQRQSRKDLTGCGHFRHRVRDLLCWEWAVCGPRIRAGLVLWHRAETHLLPLRHRGLLPGTHRDPSGHQSHRSQGESRAAKQQLFEHISVIWDLIVIIFSSGVYSYNKYTFSPGIICPQGSKWLHEGFTLAEWNFNLF